MNGLFRALKVGAWRGVKRVEEALADDPIIHPATRIRETGGPTILNIAGVADGEYLVRSGTSVTGGPGGAGTGPGGTENPPQLAYAKASQIQALAPPGATTALSLWLSDGALYIATSPLSVDLTVGGRGGLDTGAEAPSTWYYIYAIPSLVAGEFVGIASIRPPAAGGPVGFNAWRYLGAVYNDSASDIILFYQCGKVFRYAAALVPAAIPLYTTTFIDPKQEPAINDTVPLTASTTFIRQRMVNGGPQQNEDIIQEIYVEGCANWCSAVSSTGNLVYFPGWLYAVIPLPGLTSKKIGYRSRKTGGTITIYAQDVFVCGYEDDWLLHWR